jgi:DNA-nicking Smr family endonuclease
MSTEPTDAERQLFRDAIGPVRQIEATTLPAPPRPRPLPRHSQADEAEVLRSLGREQPIREGAESGEVLSYIAPGYAHRYLRRLIRGQYVVADEIDLHHLDLRRARELLAGFLRHCQSEGRLCLRLIHGKGGQKGSVIKAMVEQELVRRSDVIAFHSAPQRQGGTGAVDVLLRPR